MHIRWLPALALATACGGRGPAAEGAAPGVAQTAAELNAAARSGAVVETIFGREVADPYRALEADDDATRAWLDGQTALSERYLAEHAAPAREQRLAELMSIGTFGGAAQAGPYLFFEKREGDADQPVLYVREEDGAPRVLLDPDTLGEKVALDWFYPSPKGTWLAYGLSRNGDERSVLHVLEVATGIDREERIEHTKWTSLAWRNDETGFYYTRYPAPGEPDFVEGEEDVYFPHLFFHSLAEASRPDPRLFRLESKTDFVAPAVSPNDRWVVLNVFHGWSESDVLLLDAFAPHTAPVPIDVTGGHLVSGEIHGDRLYLMTNEDHPRYRIVAAPLEAPADRRGWIEIVPEGEGAMESFGFAADRLVVRFTENVAARLRLFGPDGAPAGEIELPTVGSVDGPAVQLERPGVVFVFQSFFHPPALYGYDPETATLRVLDRVESDVDPARYEVERHAVASADGTPINVFLARERELPRDGRRPVLLYGYGGFNVSLLPYFRSHALYWLERGGVLATANLRGGAEFGEEWHRAGMLENKHLVFDDFEAVLRWLPSTGLTTPERIAIYGASNGGLLMGAMIARCPETFRAAATYVGLYDMVRFDRFPPAEIWMSELGNPAEPEAFAYLLDYSPYHGLRDGTAYPAVLVETADRDTRVSWKHSTKFAARLQEATTSGRPVLFYLDREQGHGAGTGLSDAIRERLRMYTFLETELGMTE